MTDSFSLRLTRLRRTEAVRSMLRETHLSPEQLIAPLFVSERISTKQAISAMPGQYQLSLECLKDEVKVLSALGIKAVLLFGVPNHKDSVGSASLRSDGIVQRAIRLIKETTPELLIIADVCFCEYTDHGHCGILSDNHIDTEATRHALTCQAISYADAGADWVAPSSMTDGMVSAIRKGLDNAGYPIVAILSYAVKYSSAFYGPFREAALGAPQFGDRKTYQMDPANAKEALREAALDIQEGADAIMVKPALHYLDVIYRVKEAFEHVPLCAYHVSGEYTMLKALANQGLIDETQGMLESLIAIKRAGADFIITYYAKMFAEYWTTQ